jgi:N6-L-threonylcarbamoyladenine synthase
VAVTDSPLDFSFSGLKSAVLRIVRECEERGADVPIADLAASFQEAVARALVSRVTAALDRFEPRALLVAGGVSANATVRAALESASPVPLLLPPLELCTDNAAMIACAGYWRLRRGAEDDLALDVDSSLRLDDPGDGGP